MYVQCNKVGNDILLLDSFVDYKKTERALSLQDQQLMVNGKSCMKRSTAEQGVCVLWKYESTTWDNLLGLKQCYIAELEEYSVLYNIYHDPYFNWWAKHVLQI